MSEHFVSVLCAKIALYKHSSFRFVLLLAVLHCWLQQQFIDDVLNTGLLLYVSRAWLSEVFHLVITQDLFTSAVTAANTQVLTTLLSGNVRFFSVRSCGL